MSFMLTSSSRENVGMFQFRLSQIVRTIFVVVVVVVVVPCLITPGQENIILWYKMCLWALALDTMYPIVLFQE